MIFNPTLPPSATAVEREVNGKRQYVSVVETPTPMERLEAQVLWTAFETDTLLEDESEGNDDV